MTTPTRRNHPGRTGVPATGAAGMRTGTTTTTSRPAAIARATGVPVRLRTSTGPAGPTSRRTGQPRRQTRRAGQIGRTGPTAAGGMSHRPETGVQSYPLPGSAHPVRTGPGRTTAVRAGTACHRRRRGTSPPLMTLARMTPVRMILVRMTLVRATGGACARVAGRSRARRTGGIRGPAKPGSQGRTTGGTRRCPAVSCGAPGRPATAAPAVRRPPRARHLAPQRRPDRSPAHRSPQAHPPPPHPPQVRQPQGGQPQVRQPLVCRTAGRPWRRKRHPADPGHPVGGRRGRRADRSRGHPRQANLAAPDLGRPGGKIPGSGLTSRNHQTGSQLAPRTLATTTRWPDHAPTPPTRTTDRDRGAFAGAVPAGQTGPTSPTDPTGPTR